MNTARFKPSAIIFYSPLVTALPGLSAPGQSSERPATEKPPHGSQAVLPTVQKNQKPSTMILKYMEGISKRIQLKTNELILFSLSFGFPGCIVFQDLKNKYESIPEASRTNTHTQLLCQILPRRVKHPSFISSWALPAEVHREASDPD